MLSVQGLGMTRGTATLFEDLKLSLAPGERLAVIGANGCGKSTLLQLLAGSLSPDTGTIHRPAGSRLRLVTQVEDFGRALTIADAFADALPDTPAHEIDAAQARLFAGSTFSAATELSTLSGGWRKRVALAIARAAKVDYLLLDEPTNHLDLSAIAELERELPKFAATMMFVSHDRQFIDRVATRVVELGSFYDGSLLSRPGGYGDFVLARREWLAQQAAAAESMRNRLRREQEWLSRRPKARTTKSQARIDAAGDLATALAENQQRQRQATKSATVSMTATGRHANELIAVENVSKSYGERTIIDAFSMTVAPGDRIVLLGDNGSGKTTLLHLLAGRLAPDAGTAKQAHGLQAPLFDQHRQGFAAGTTIQQALAPTGDMVDLPDGSRQHVRAFAESLGFGRERLAQQADQCSGGELARLHVGQLMTTACDVLLLDEPTNDLDLQLRETLEAALAAFSGAVILISHDRWFCEQVGDVFLGLDGAGGVARFTSFAAWEAAHLSQKTSSQKDSSQQAAVESTEKPKAAAINPKIARQLRAQVQKAERAVEQCEERLAALQERWSDPAVSNDPQAAQKLSVEIAQVEDELALAMKTWEEAVESYPG